jgi:phage-related protein
MAGNTVLLKFAGDDKQLAATLARVGDSSERMADRVGRAGNSMLSLASKLATAGSAVNAVSGAMGGLAVASGALLALPAAGVAAAGVMAAVKLGAEGAARAFEKLKTSVDPLKAAVSESFEKSLNPAVSNLNTILPKLRGPLQGIVTQLGGMATEATRVAKMPQNMGTLNTVLGGTGTAMGNLKKAVAPLTQAFFDLVSVAAPGIKNIGANAQGLAQSFADWVREAKESGKLKQWLDSGIAALKQMWAALQDIVGIVGGVFRGLSQGAGGAVAPFGMLLDAINRIVNSAEGQEVLKAIGQALRTIGEAITSVAMPAFQALAPLIPPLLELFSSVVEILAENLVPVIEFLAPGLEAIAGFIERNVSWLGPLAAGLTVAAGAFWLVNAAMNANPIMLIVTLLASLVVAFVSLWEQSAAFRDFFIGMWNGIKSVVGGVVDWIVGRWNDVVGFFQGIPDAIGRAFGRVGDIIGRAFKGALNVAIDIINWFIGRANDAIYGINVVSPFDDIPYIGYIGRLHTGGKVGGAPGTEQLKILQAGETVTSAANSSGGGGTATVAFVGDTDGAFASAFQNLMRTGAIQIEVS